MKKYLLLLFHITATLSTWAQPYKYIDSSLLIRPDTYANYIKNQPHKQLVEIKKLIPEMVLDIRYATPNNFTGEQVYAEARAFARLPVVKALQAIQTELKEQGLALKIFDAYRPYAITVIFYESTSDTAFVANPRKGSRHNRGCAIDLTLIDLKSGKELEMPTGYDSFTPQAAADYPNLPPVQLHNRALLRNIMEKHGFKVYPYEWWHFDFNEWEQYELVDVPFSLL